MTSRSDDPPTRRTRRHSPPTTPEGREAQIISYAYDLVERRIREGTASAQETVHFLKLGSSSERLAQQKMALESELLQVKRDQIAAEAKAELMYREALDAMRRYSGQDVPQPEDERADDYYG